MLYSYLEADMMETGGDEDKFFISRSLSFVFELQKQKTLGSVNKFSLVARAQKKRGKEKELLDRKNLFTMNRRDNFYS